MPKKISGKSKAPAKSPTQSKVTKTGPAKGRTAAAKAPKTAKGNKSTKGSKTSARSTAKAAAPARKPSPATDRLEGAKAPNFRLIRDGGSQVALADFAGKNLVVFFYPKANTPGCTREAIDFTRLNAQFAKANTAVIGVSADSAKAQEKFRDGHNLKVPLGADESRAMLKAYGAWGLKSNYGKTYEGIIRSTVLIDSAGRVARVWRNVKVDGHAEAVLEAARAL